MSPTFVVRPSQLTFVVVVGGITRTLVDEVVSRETFRFVDDDYEQGLQDDTYTEDTHIHGNDDCGVRTQGHGRFPWNYYNTQNTERHKEWEIAREKDDLFLL